jgi:hypothetical protein
MSRPRRKHPQALEVQAQCGGTLPTGGRCPNFATSNGYCRACAPLAAADLYSRGLDAPGVATLDALTTDPYTRDLSREIARQRLLLDRTYERHEASQTIARRMRADIQRRQGEACGGPLSETEAAALNQQLEDLEAVEVLIGRQAGEIVTLNESIRRTVETHAKVQDGRVLAGAITEGDVMAFIRALVEIAVEEAGTKKAGRIVARIQALSSRRDLGIPAPSLPAVRGKESPPAPVDPTGGGVQDSGV